MATNGLVSAAMKKTVVPAKPPRPEDLVNPDGKPASDIQPPVYTAPSVRPENFGVGNQPPSVRPEVPAPAAPAPAAPAPTPGAETNQTIAPTGSSPTGGGVPASAQ